MEIINRKAYHDYFIHDKYTAGIVLKGTEIKSIRNGQVNLKDSFIRIENGEAFLYNCHISQYSHGNIYNHEEKRIRKLLLNKREILRLSEKVKQDGFSIIPIQIIVGRYAKIEIALAKGKKLYNKKEDLIKKAQMREI